MSKQPDDWGEGDGHEPGDPPELDRVVDALRSAWSEVPDVDRATIWSAIEGNLGPQDDPGRDPRPGFLRGALGGLFVGNPLRQLALAGTAVAVVAAVVLSGALQSGTSARAAVLEAVSSLSETATAALDDDSLSSQELMALRTEAARLLDEVERSEEGLRGLSPRELRGVIDTLELLILQLDPHADDDAEDFVSAVTSIRMSSETARGVFADYEGDEGFPFDDDDLTPVGSTPVPGGAIDDDPRATATASATATPSATGTPEPQGTPEPGATPEPGSTPEPAQTPEAEDTPHPEDTPEPGATPGPEETATPEPTSTTEPTATPAPTATPDPTVEPPGESTSLIPAVAGSYEAAARDAGSVSYSFAGGTLTVTDVNVASGWSAEVQESAGSEIRVEFSRGLERVRLEVERQDPNLEVNVRWWTVAGNG